MNELSFYAQRIAESKEKLEKLEQILAKANNLVTQSMVRYELLMADKELETWEEMAKEHLCYIV